MSLLRSVKGWLGLDPDSVTRGESVSVDKPLFVYVKLPGDIQPLERGERFEDPLEAVLQRSGLGTITGGGSQLDEPHEDGRPRVEFAGLDVDLYDVARGLALLRAELVRLGAPAGTSLLYELDGQEHELGIGEPS